MPSRRRVQPPAQKSNPPAPKRPAGISMSPAMLAAIVGTARHDRHLAGTRLGASRKLATHMRSSTPQAGMTAQERQRHLEEAAYYNYLRRGHGPGSPDADWFAAERDLDHNARRT